MATGKRLTGPEKVRQLRTVLHAKAKEEPGRRFHALIDKVWREDFSPKPTGGCAAIAALPGWTERTSPISSRMARRIGDGRMLGLIKSWLENAGGGGRRARRQATDQSVAKGAEGDSARVSDITAAFQPLYAALGWKVPPPRLANALTARVSAQDGVFDFFACVRLQS